MSSIKNQTRIVGDTKEIIVTRKDGTQLIVLVDADFELPNSVYVDNYPMTWFNGKKIFLHRYIYGDISKGNQVDHISHNKLDCRMRNLREVTRNQNQRNKRVKGYSFDNQKMKWRSYITVNNKVIKLGYYDSEVLARISYLQAKLKYHGEEFSPIGTREELDNLMEEVENSER